MTQFVFALVTMMGQQTISTEYFESIDVCLWYSSRINSQHSHHNHYHQHSDPTDQLHAQCRPTRVNPDAVTIYYK
jgi:hypothetical protein